MAAQSLPPESLNSAVERGLAIFTDCLPKHASADVLFHTQDARQDEMIISVPLFSMPNLPSSMRMWLSISSVVPIAAMAPLESDCRHQHTLNMRTQVEKSLTISVQQEKCSRLACYAVVREKLTQHIPKRLVPA